MVQSFTATVTGLEESLKVLTVAQIVNCSCVDHWIEFVIIQGLLYSNPSVDTYSIRSDKLI